MNDIIDIPVLLGNDAATLDEDGWALIAPFGEHPKTRTVKKNGRIEEEKFIQVLDEESAGQLLSRENSLFRRIRRAVVGIPVYKGHPDLRDYSPETVAGNAKKEIIGTIDRVRKTARGIEAHFVLTPAGAEAVERQGHKYPSALWLVQPTGRRGDVVIARPFKLLSAGLTAHPNISGVESLANACAGKERWLEEECLSVGVMGGMGQMGKSAGETPATATGKVAVRETEGNGEEGPLSLPSPRIGGERGGKPPLGETSLRVGVMGGMGQMGRMGTVALSEKERVEGREESDFAETLRHNKHTKEPDMKLIAGWLLAQGAALAAPEAPTEHHVLEAFQKLHAAKAGEVMALGNEKSQAAAQISALENEVADLRTRISSLKSDRTSHAAAVVDLAIARGKMNVAERAGKIEALGNAQDFEKESAALLASATRYRTTGNSEGGKALSNQGADGDAREEYCASVEKYMKETGETDPIKAHHAVMQRHPGLAEKLQARGEM
jgi:hypothetical protein